MHAIFEVSKDVSNISSNYASNLSMFDKLTSAFGQIDVHLENTLWSGATQERCVHVHDVIKQYANLVRPICQELSEHIRDLDSNADSFAQSSDLVNTVRQI